LQVVASVDAAKRFFVSGPFHHGRTPSDCADATDVSFANVLNRHDYSSGLTYPQGEIDFLKERGRKPAVYTTDFTPHTTRHGHQIARGDGDDFARSSSPRYATGWPHVADRPTVTARRRHSNGGLVQQRSDEAPYCTVRQMQVFVGYYKQGTRCGRCADVPSGCNAEIAPRL
jgi:hypothetical protein